jgi:hypothetical protein
LQVHGKHHPFLPFRSYLKRLSAFLFSCRAGEPDKSGL